MHSFYVYMHFMQLSGIDLDLLVALDVLLETGSVSGAAKHLNRSQPAVSRMLGRLRDLFGDPLFVPHGRGLAPTPRALAIRGPLKLTLTEVQHLISPPRPFDPARDSAHFRIISSDYAAVTLMGAVVKALHLAAPRVHVTLLAVGDRPDRMLAAGEADLMLGPPSMVPPWCASKPFIDDQWVCVRRKGEVLPRTRAEYHAMEHVAVRIEHVFGRRVDAAAARRGPTRPTRVTVPDFAAALFVVATSSLLATLPRPLATAASQIMPLEIGDTPFPIAASPIAMIWPRRLESEPSHIWLRQAVTDSVGPSAKPARR